MLRFVSSNEPASLLNYVFAIKIVADESSSSKSGQVEYRADLTQLYPNSTIDPSIQKSVQLFAFPDRSAIESRCFFTFVIGNTSTEFQLGFVRYYTYFDAYCVLSDYYYPDLFKDFMSLPRNEMKNVCMELTNKIVRDSFVIKDTKYNLDGGRERQRLTALLFRTFPAYDLTKIIIGMLTARHVFIVAANASTCSLFSAAIPLLIEPFIWDLNLIPILPMKILDMIAVPVPAMIGVTRSEILEQKAHEIAPHILVNADTKHVLDYPVFEADSPAVRIQVVKIMMEFSSVVTKTIKDWQDCPGFPYQVLKIELYKFIASYLQVYTGQVVSSTDLLNLMGTKFPEYLSNSQVVHQLLTLDELDEKRKKDFKKWFDSSFIKDFSINMKKVVNSKPYQNKTNIDPNVNINNRNLRISGNNNIIINANNNPTLNLSSNTISSTIYANPLSNSSNNGINYSASEGDVSSFLKGGNNNGGGSYNVSSPMIQQNQPQSHQLPPAGGSLRVENHNLFGLFDQYDSQMTNQESAALVASDDTATTSKEKKKRHHKHHRKSPIQTDSDDLSNGGDLIAFD